MTIPTNVYNEGGYGSITFYSFLDRTKLEEISASFINAEFTMSTGGVAMGSFEIALEGPEALQFFKERKRLSSFVTFAIGGNDLFFGGLISGVVIKSDNVAYVECFGFTDYLAHIVAFLSERYQEFTQSGQLVIDKEDRSFEKVFQSDTLEGILYGVFDNLEEQMIHQGFAPFWRFKNIIEKIQSKKALKSEWDHEYRLNSTEFPAYGDIFSEISGNVDCSRIEITPKVDGDEFYWELAFDSNLEASAEEAEITNFEYDLAGVMSARNSVARAEDKDGNIVLSHLGYYMDSTYSAIVAGDRNNKATSNARKINADFQVSNNAIQGQCSFETTDPHICKVGASLTLNFPTETFVIVISEVSFSTKDLKLKVTGNIVASLDDAGLLTNKTPHSDINLLYKDIATANKNAEKAMLDSARPTGLR